MTSYYRSGRVHLCRRPGAIAQAPKALRILGPHRVRYALSRAHKVTLFNRGLTNAGMFAAGPNLELLVGDRAPNPGNYEALTVRIERGGEVLAPPAGDPVQFIDGRDLGEWTIRCVEDGTCGVFNTIGPATKFTVRQMLEGIRDTINSNATFTNTTNAFPWTQKPPVRGWSDLPVWIAPQGSYAGFSQRSIAKALSKGLTIRPFADTVRETIAFYKAQTPERQAALRAGLTPTREREVLAAWHAKQHP